MTHTTQTRPAPCQICGTARGHERWIPLEPLYEGGPARGQWVTTCIACADDPAVADYIEAEGDWY